MSNKLCINLFGVLLAILITSCATPERVILLPQADGSPSSVIVQTKSGRSAVLDQPYTEAKVSNTRIRLKSTSDTDVNTRYPALLSALPPRPKSYQLFFDIGGTQLTAKSESLIQTIIQELSTLPEPELTVIGHTDSVGTDEVNDALSLERALSVVEILKSKGIDTKRTSTVGRGKRAPLVQTQDGVAELQNRRVEIRLK